MLEIDLKETQGFFDVLSKLDHLKPYPRVCFPDRCLTPSFNHLLFAFLNKSLPLSLKLNIGSSH
jgi:hypothetical protein